MIKLVDRPPRGRAISAVRVDYREGAGRAVLTVEGDISLINSREIRAALERAVQSNQPIVAVDLERVPYMDSSGIGCLIACQTALKKSERTLALIAVPETIQRTLEVTNVRAFFTICSSLDELPAAGS